MLHAAWRVPCDPTQRRALQVNAMIGVNTAQAELVVLTDVTQVKDCDLERSRAWACGWIADADRHWADGVWLCGRAVRRSRTVSSS